MIEHVFILNITISLKFAIGITQHKRQTPQENLFNLKFCKKVAKIRLKT